MATIKSYTDIDQSNKLADILPLESADMTLPFRHPKNDEYIPGYVVSRNYVEAYNEMMKLPAMEKEDVCKLIQPSWSLTALLHIIRETIGYTIYGVNNVYMSCNLGDKPWKLETEVYDNEVDACVEMIIKLHEMNLL